MSKITRRKLFKLTCLGALGVFMPLKMMGAGQSNSTKTASQNEPNSAKREFSVSLKHKILEKGDLTRLWVPLPHFRDYQQLTSDIEFVGNFTQAFISNTKIPTLYAEFKNKEPYLDINFSVATFERNVNLSTIKPKGELAQSVKEYLKATAHIQTSGIVKSTAQSIIKKAKAKDDLQKAHALFEWVASNMQRDESIIGCGVGDARAILESKKLVGKCTDISSVFVALCRSVQIPAREVFGIRLGQSKYSNAMGSAKDKVANITKAQHCRAEFYIKGFGWIPADPGDVAKVRLSENLSNDDAKIKQLKGYLFGNWEMNWLGFNNARDFILTPTPEESPLNNFNYPYCEVDGNVLNYYEPSEFSYEYVSVER